MTAMDQIFRRILLIKPGAVGDLLQLTPTIRALKRKFPAAAIDLMVGSAAAATMFHGNPSLHETFVFDRDGEHRSLAGFMGLWRRVRSARYDLVVNFQRSNLKAWLLIAAALPCRMVIYRKAQGRTVHAVVNHLETTAPLGIDPSAEDLSLEIWTGPDDDRFASELFSRHGLDGSQVVALNPGASHLVNRWPLEHFARLIDRLSRRNATGIVLIGGGQDQPLADQICGMTTGRPVNLAGKTTITQLAAVLRDCSLLVSGDTGPMHLATAVNTPVIALFGAADPSRTGPVGSGHTVLQASDVGCVPCRSRTCDNEVYLECMEKISVDKVYDAIAERLGW